MKNEHYESAREALLTQEGSYALDWVNDAERLFRDGLYDTIADLVKPKADEVIVDIGTGTGLQLLSLAQAEGQAITIGTERTRVNVSLAYKYLSGLGLKDALNALAPSTLAVSAEDKLFWKPELQRVADHMAKIRRELSKNILLLEDNILAPALLPHVLEDRPIDAGILSMPGGSISRLVEWPYDAMSNLTQTAKLERMKEVTDTTRFAFFHYMSEHVRPGGRIVVAERMLTDPNIERILGIQLMIAKHMGPLRKYWESTTGALLETELSDTTVRLIARDSQQGMMSGKSATEKGFRPHIGIIRYDRNDVPFEEAPLPRPA